MAKIARQIWGIWADQNRRFFGPWDLQLWRMTLKNNREPLPCLYKLCVSFHNHPWIRIRVTKRKQSYQSKLSVFFLSVYSMLYVILCYNGPCYKRVPTVHISAFAMYCFKTYHIQTCHCPIYLAPSFHLIRFISVFQHEVQSVWMLYVRKGYPCKRISYIMFYLRSVKYPTG